MTLTKFSDCSSLDQAIVDTVVLQMKSQLEMIEAGYFYPVPLANGGPVPANAGNASGPSAYTTTTAQVAGVDEADFVQNDGTRIFVLSGDSLYAASSWPPQSLALKGQLTIEGWPREMFLSGNQVVVFSSLYVPRPFDGTASNGNALIACPVAIDSEWACGYSMDDATKITTVDVTNLSSPTVTSEVYLPGSYLTSRLIGSQVRLVLNDPLPFPQGVLFGRTFRLTPPQRNAPRPSPSWSRRTKPSSAATPSMTGCGSPPTSAPTERWCSSTTAARTLRAATRPPGWESSPSPPWRSTARV